MENNNNNNNSDDRRISDSDDVMGFDINEPHQELFIVSDADDLDDEAFYVKYPQRLKELKARIAAEKAKETKQLSEPIFFRRRMPDPTDAECSPFCFSIQLNAIQLHQRHE